MSTDTAMGQIPEFTIGDRLRKARELTGLDQTEFGREIGASRATVSTYESGAQIHRKPIYLRAWALRSGVPIWWLETGTHDEGPRPAMTRDAGRARRPRHDSNVQPTD